MKLLPLLLCLPLLGQVSSKTAVSGKVGSVSRIPPGGGSFTVNVVSGDGNPSNTQVLLSYTAPTTSACTVEVSESASYTPVVNDVDTGKFSGSDSDNRDGNLGAGTTSRLTLVGRRTADVATDTNYYSRALQANTLHYAKVTCGSDVGTTTFTTANIPPGMTYTDYPYPFAAGEYNWKLPTFFGNDRSITQVDQFTGLLYKPLTIWDDRVQGGAPVQGFNMSQGGFIQQCTAGLQSTPFGDQFVCQFYEEANNFTSFYAIRPSDGQVTSLGFASPRAGAPLYILGTDMCYEGAAGGQPNKKYCYTGDWTEEHEFVHDGGTAYNSVSSNDQLIAFDATFDAALFGCADFWAPKFAYHVFTCPRLGGGQDDYGWLVFYYGGDGRVYGSGSCGAVVAGGDCPGILGAVNTMIQPGFRFQSIHNSQALPNVPTNPTVPMAFINWQQLNDNSRLGRAQWSTTLAADVTTGHTTVTVVGCPQSEYAGGDTFDPGCWNAAGGDILNIGPGNLVVTTGAPSGSGPYILPIAAYSGGTALSGAAVIMRGNATILDTTYGYFGGSYLSYWSPSTDPHGTSMVKDACYDPGGHGAYGLHGRIGEGSFQIIYGDISTQISTCPIPLQIDDSPRFHGLRGYCFSTACNKHPTYAQTDTSIVAEQQNHISDGLTWNGGTSFTSGPATQIEDDLYLYNGATGGGSFASDNYAHDKTVLYRKLFPTVAITGYYPYVDISGPSSHITGAAGDNGKYCVAYLAGECRNAMDMGGASAAGDIFVNLVVPGSMFSLDCLGADGPRPDRNDLCIGTFPTMGRVAVPQIYIDASSSADAISKSRLQMGGGVRGVRGMVAFSFAKILPDASWYMMQTGLFCAPNIEAQFCNIWLAKNLPIRTPDAYDRSDFIPITTGTITGGGSVDNAIVKFWYLEFGTMSDALCTSRAESCYVNSASIPSGANPYSYASDAATPGDLTTLTGVACSTTCTINIPALSGHTLYYQIIKRNSSNAVLSTGTTQMVVVP